MLPALLAMTACRPTLRTEAVATHDAPQRYAELLQRVVTPDGYVDYDVLEADRAPLDAYVAWLATPSTDAGSETTSSTRHAHWLNAYNALVLFSVLEHGRPASVMDVPGPAPGAGFFLLHDFQIGKNQLSLWEIEHERLRMRYQDERDHSAMNCAARSCPPLSPELFTGRGLRNQLEDSMERWVADDERGVRFDGDELIVSPIFEWFAEDFDMWTGHVDLCTFLADHARAKRRKRLRKAARKGCSYRTFEYDWTLNDASADG